MRLHLPTRGDETAARILRRIRPALSLACCFCSIFAVTAVIGIGNSGNLLWFANGLLLSYLLLVPRWLLEALFFHGFVAILFGGLAVNPNRWPKCIALQRSEYSWR